MKAAKPSLDADLLAEGTMTIVDAAKFTGLSIDTVRRGLEEGTIPWTQLRPAGRRLIPRLALIALLAKNMVNGGTVTT